MIAVDANVLVRLVVRDDDVQAGRAVALFEQNEIYVCKTVSWGLEWTSPMRCTSREAAQFATFDTRLKRRADSAAPGRHVREA